MRSPKEKESRKLWDNANIDKVKAMRKHWYYKHRERILQERKAYNPKRNIVLKLRRSKHPERVRLDNYFRRTLTRDLTIQVIQRVYENNIKQYGTLTCYLCLNPILFGKDHLEHRIPLSRRGTNREDNLAVACQTCNCSKNNKTEEEYRRLLNGAFPQSAI